MLASSALTRGSLNVKSLSYPLCVCTYVSWTGDPLFCAVSAARVCVSVCVPVRASVYHDDVRRDPADPMERSVAEASIERRRCEIYDR